MRSERKVRRMQGKSMIKRERMGRKGEEEEKGSNEALLVD
jgi:hypothetical protein